jgi:hypothetical protein
MMAQAVPSRQTCLGQWDIARHVFLMVPLSIRENRSL